MAASVRSIRIRGRLCLGQIPMRHYVKMSTVPKLVHSGRVLMHNHVRHSKDMPCGANGFRAWTDNMPPPPGFKPCRCGWAGLPHYSRIPDYKCVPKSMLPR